MPTTIAGVADATAARNKPATSTARSSRGARRPRRSTRAILIGLTVVLFGSACTVTRTQHFQVDVAQGIYVHLYQRPSWQTVLYNDWPREGNHFCSGYEYCTLRFMRDQVSINWVGSNPITDIDYFFHSDQRDDFADALDQVRGTDPQKCLLLHRHHLPWGDRHNWTSSSAGGSCKLGELVEA